VQKARNANWTSRKRKRKKPEKLIVCKPRKVSRGQKHGSDRKRGSNHLQILEIKDPQKNSPGIGTGENHQEMMFAGGFRQAGDRGTMGGGSVVGRSPGRAEKILVNPVVRQIMPPRNHREGNEAYPSMENLLLYRKRDLREEGRTHDRGGSTK